MKKLFSLVFALCLVLLPVLSPAEGNADEIWYLYAIRSGGESLNPADVQMDARIILKADGMARLISSADGEINEQAGTWTQDNSAITIENDETVTLLIKEDDLLTTDVASMTLVFSKEPPEASSVPEPIDAEHEEAFLGHWHLVSINIDQSIVPAELFGTEMNLEVEEGKVTLFADSDVTEYDTTFSEGILQLSAEGSSLTLACNDQGGLSMDERVGDQLFMILYFEKTEEP